jgi:cytidylate kinase
MTGPADLNTYLPLLILVSGAPGSGKTTLAAKIAEEMKLLHIERDLFFRSMEHAAGKRQINRLEIGVPLFYRTISDLLEAGISLVIDGTLYKGLSEDDLRRLRELADVVNLHCRADQADERFYEREVKRADGTIPDWLQKHMTHLKRIKSSVEHPLELDWDRIEVETGGEYRPSIAELASRLDARVLIKSARVREEKG